MRTVSDHPALKEFDEPEDFDMTEAAVFEVATRLIEQHGAGAALVAAEHVRQKQEQGDLQALQHWTRILEMIEKIRSLPEAGDSGEARTR